MKWWNVLTVSGWSFLFWNKPQYLYWGFAYMYLSLKAQKAVKDGAAVSCFLTSVSCSLPSLWFFKQRGSFIRFLSHFSIPKCTPKGNIFTLLYEWASVCRVHMRITGKTVNAGSILCIYGIQNCMDDLAEHL